MAVVCDTDDCFAVHLAMETGDDEDARSASEVSQLARHAAQGDGWVVSFGFRQPVMTCPGRPRIHEVDAGRAPVSEVVGD
ncbi:hypothetical protein [Streptomyces tibetensis]|uniref:hypothetical protein n=1 Tax=Streptomyces tibetensis TaxID=2382123 RepID=UPI0033F80DCF